MPAPRKAASSRGPYPLSDVSGCRRRRRTSGTRILRSRSASKTSALRTSTHVPPGRPKNHERSGIEHRLFVPSLRGCPIGPSCRSVSRRMKSDAAVVLLKPGGGGIRRRDLLPSDCVREANHSGAGAVGGSSLRVHRGIRLTSSLAPVPIRL